MNLLKRNKIGFIGTGKMAQAFIKALIDSNTISKEQIYVTNRSIKKQEKVVQQFGVHGLKNNEELVQTCDIVFLCMKPQDLMEAILPIAQLLDESHLVISMAAGVSLESLQKALPDAGHLVRIMPNTPIKVCKGVIGYCLAEESDLIEEQVCQLLTPMGKAIKAEEGDQFEALTVTCASGPGFIFELMAYWQDWLEEHGFDEIDAKLMTVQTFLGSAILADQSNLDLSQLQEEVVSKKGVTYSGLESMRELEIERLLRYSFEKAALRDRELGKTLG